MAAEIKGSDSWPIVALTPSATTDVAAEATTDVAARATADVAAEATAGVAAEALALDDDAKRLSQDTMMQEAYSLAESMEAMTHEHQIYHNHFTALMQDLTEARKYFANRRLVERIQRMTESMSGMFTICAMFEDLRNRKTVPKSHEDPIAFTVHFEDRIIRTIKFFARELQQFTAAMEVGCAIPVLQAPAEEPAVAETNTTVGPAVDPDADVPALEPAQGDALSTEPMTDEEFARKLQAEDDDAYAKLLSRRVYHYRPATTAGGYAASTAAPIANQEVAAFLDSVSTSAPDT
jgi:hypothetical protein